MIKDLKILVIGLSHKCQANCSSCPHSIPNWKKEHGEDMLSIKSANIILEQLKQINFKGLISFSGKGEPLLNSNLLQILQLFKQYNTRLITNYNISQNIITNLENVYLKKLILSNKNKENFQKRNNLIIESKLDKPIYFNNRGLQNLNIQNIPSKTCHLATYKLQIQPNGDFCYCPNSFLHYQKPYNIYNTSILQFWTIHHKQFRQNAINGRLNQICKFCNCNGQL